MNDLLQLKGNFEQKSNSSSGGGSTLPKNATVTAEHLEKLHHDLTELFNYWKSNDIINGALISVYYTDVIAKSRRISGTFSHGKITSNSSIVGAKFSRAEKLKHIITHFVSLALLHETIQMYDLCIDVLKNQFGGVITCENIEHFKTRHIVIPIPLSKTLFLKIIVDAYFVEGFGIDTPTEKFSEPSIVTLYKTGIATVDLLNKIGIKIFPNRIIDNSTILLTRDELSILMDKAPYLVSMAVSDISKIDYLDSEPSTETRKLSIPSPANEPVIGVIDTLFDKSVYFSEWVEFTNMIDKGISTSPKDYFHGTEVSSIIVDGPAFNPDLDDGCGRFRVRHFGVAVGNKFSSFSILRSINEIIAKNKDIKVWNLSLGSSMEINPYFISPEAAVLDRIQYENDVIFIIAGTNKQNDDSLEQFIGAPADSINSLVVNSVDTNGKPVEYSRKGPVLSFFIKPDISYYGGTTEKPIRVCSPAGERFVKGTSFAAPWIARKMSYLIDVMGLSREVAKALIIDSATGWTEEKYSPHIIGYGAVPQRIEDILKSPKDEIRFILSGVSEKYDTYTYNLPVPTNEGKHPYVAKATLCYFPYCSRNQGVDYTNTELDISFGRIDPEAKNPIKSINNNYQTVEGHFTYEGTARTFYRKWDNVKHIREVRRGKRPKKVYTGIWGLSIKTKERIEEKFGTGLRFGVVVTLKEINGVNRIEDFIQQCSLRGWLVNKINIENRIEIYNKAEQNISFDEV